MRFFLLLLLGLATSMSFCPGRANAAPAATENPFRKWGLEEIRHIDAAFLLPPGGLYADEIAPGPPPVAGHPAFMWGCGIQLSALNAAARVDRVDYLPEVRRYVTALEAYWVESRGLGGYEVLPRPNPPDRYYDDNEWIVLDLVDAYDLTHDPHILAQARKTFHFAMSGEDDTLGGGLFWHEGDLKSKNTCSNAPAIVGALRLFQATHDRSYLATAYRLYAWTNAHLQDTDGLFFDSVGVDGDVHRQKFSYNSALMIRANALLFQLTHDGRFLAEAQRIARAAEGRWVRPETGAIADDAAFAHLLSESFLFLYDQDHDAHHLAVVRRALQSLHDHGRDAAGDYAGHWDQSRRDGDRVSLKADASAARADLLAALWLKN